MKKKLKLRIYSSISDKRKENTLFVEMSVVEILV